MKAKDLYFAITLICALIFILVTGNNLVYIFSEIDFWGFYFKESMGNTTARFWVMIFSWVVSGDFALLFWILFKVSNLEPPSRRV